MTRLKLTILVPAAAPHPVLVTAVSPRTLHHADELAQALGEATGSAVTVIEGTLADAPQDGYLLVFGLPSTADIPPEARVIALDLDRSTVMKRMEAQTLVAAVEKQRYFAWCTKRPAERGDGLIGRRDVAARMGARVVSGPYTSPHYALLASDSATDLVGLLLAYLVEHAVTHTT